MSRALVLNATYEPLSVVSSRRAVVLLWADKADMVAPSGLSMHSESLTLVVPSVVRLRQYVRVPFQRCAALNRRSLFARDGGRCQYCLGPAESIDHVLPRAKGGQHVWENVVAACQSCNTAKGDRLLAETNLELATVPRAPRGHGWVAFSVGIVPEAWIPYIEPAWSDRDGEESSRALSA